MTFADLMITLPSILGHVMASVMPMSVVGGPAENLGLAF